MRRDRSRQILEVLRSPDGSRLTAASVGIVFGIVGLWLLIAGVLSLLPVWMLLPATAAFVAYTFTRQTAEQRRQARADAGRCVVCGYDLRATPDVCPECGRDARLDEPSWRRLRRTYAEARAKEAAGISDPPIVLPMPTIKPGPSEPIPVRDESAE